MKKDKKQITIPIEQIPAEGNLGLMALGDIGVKAWRDAKRRKKSVSDKKNQSSN